MAKSKAELMEEIETRMREIGSVDLEALSFGERMRFLVEMALLDARRRLIAARANPSPYQETE